MKYVYVRVIYPDFVVVLQGTTRREVRDWMQYGMNHQWVRLEWMKRAPEPDQCLGSQSLKRGTMWRGDCKVVAMQRSDGSYV